MRRPRGHFRVGDGDLTFIAVGCSLMWTGFLLFVVPMVSAAALLVLPILKIWFAFSWYWLLIPAVVLAGWASIVCYAQG